MPPGCKHGDDMLQEESMKQGEREGAHGGQRADVLNKF